MQINQLPASTSLANNDVLVKETSGGTTQKITGQNMAGSVKTLANLLGTGDVVNNLTSTATDKPLSAAQGKALNEAIQQSTATVDEKLRKSVQYTSTTPIDTGIVVSGSNTLKRVSLYNTSLSMPNGSWVQVGTLASDTWVMSINGVFRLSTDNNKAFFIGQYFNVRWDINSGIIYVMQTYSSSTLTVSVNLSVDYF